MRCELQRSSSSLPSSYLPFSVAPIHYRCEEVFIVICSLSFSDFVECEASVWCVWAFVIAASFYMYVCGSTILRYSFLRAEFPWRWLPNRYSNRPSEMHCHAQFIPYMSMLANSAQSETGRDENKNERVSFVINTSIDSIVFFFFSFSLFRLHATC